MRFNPRPAIFARPFFGVAASKGGRGEGEYPWNRLFAEKFRSKGLSATWSRDAPPLTSVVSRRRAKVPAMQGGAGGAA